MPNEMSSMPRRGDQNRESETNWPAPAWAADRWQGISRDYSLADVTRLAGSMPIAHTLAERGAARLWRLLADEEFVPTLGAYTGNQAVQHIRAGLKAIYLSGWQVAADANSSGQMYPDQSLYPVDSVPAVVKRINQAFQRADQVQEMEHANGEASTNFNFFAPIIADAEAGFGGPLNAFELMKAMIEAGAAGVHFEDREEMRPSRRQGAGAHGDVHPHPERRAAGGGRPGCPDPDHGAHRRQRRATDHQRHRRTRPAVPHR